MRRPQFSIAGLALVIFIVAPDHASDPQRVGGVVGGDVLDRSR